MPNISGNPSLESGPLRKDDTNQLEDCNKEKSVFFDVQKLAKMLPFPDFVTSLITRPVEVTGTLGMACSLAWYEFRNHQVNDSNSSNSKVEVIIRPRFINLPMNADNGEDKNAANVCDFAELKAGERARSRDPSQPMQTFSSKSSISLREM
mmetsp:Transcript_17029/g.23415  ORF Transcript_17029/g.23415 Transcript_17029/m.23415 type:complete len:151 (+) Transcript_17029:228-680(+)